MNDAEAGKRAAAAAAVALVRSDMVLGLGSGTTMRFALEALGRRVREEHLRIVGVPTSMQSEALALTLGITVAESEGTPIDLALDGADEIERGTLRLIKGLGGALLREKIVAQNSRRFVVVADSSKLVEHLGERAPLPVEVEPFGHTATARRLAALGGQPALRLDAGEPFETDGGHLIYDCAGFAPIRDPFTLERELYAVAGVIGTGLFMQCVERAVVGAPDGTVAVLLAE